MIFLANVNVYQNYQNPVPSTSRQSYSSIYTPPEFEPVKKKARNLDNEDNALCEYIINILEIQVQVLNTMAIL